ncbi:multidrug efflux RND transporter permease subunit [Bordetella tumulicola]|uniref:multidrug efflux RND transporter permease subunit n=1 Tax=Bordetella tumulicola TaxID=1649133 RepID=UPI0039EF5142
MPEFFIKRPKFAWVLAIFITLAGILAIPSLPMARYPEVAPPRISINATYPGASASVMVDSVISVIEEELNGVRNLLYFESSGSSNGTAEINVTFQPGTDPNMAQVDVQNRLTNAEARLPQAVLQQGVEVDQASSNFLMMVVIGYQDGVENPSRVQLGDFIARNINNELRRIPGVGRLSFFGAEAAMRVWVDAGKLQGYSLSIADVRNAIAAQNVQVPAGSFGSMPTDSKQELSASLSVDGMLADPEAFGGIVLRANPDGSAVYLRDVARIEINSENFNFQVRANGQMGIATGIQLAPNANALETAAAVRERLQELSASFPDGVEYRVPYDTSRFVEVAINKVIQTLLEAIVLVFLVMLLFLQNLRYTLIPTIVVPVCLMGTFAMMLALGFSINMMTMFGMVLAIGILVDDAIVVVENVERIMAEEGLSPRDATVKAMRQVSGAIVGITLVLAGVFVPLAFMSGSVGVIYRQFSLSLAVSILLSGFLALTFTPALCATLLKPIPPGHHHEKKGFFGWFNKRFGRITERYAMRTSRSVRRTGRYMAIYAVLVAVLAVLYMRLPESFVPLEDQGVIFTDIRMPPGATQARMEEMVKQHEAYIATRENFVANTAVMGFSFSASGQTAGVVFSVLEDWSERGRGESAMDEIALFNRAFRDAPDGRLMAISPPAIPGLGVSGGFAMRLQDRGGVGRDTLIEARDQLLAQALASPLLSGVRLEGLADAPELHLEVDRSKMEALGVSFDRVAGALSAAFGSATVNDFINAGRTQRVIIQSDIGDRLTPEGLERVYVPNREGNLVPLTSFVLTDWRLNAAQSTRYNGYLAFRIAGDAAPGGSSGEAMAEMERIASTLPEGIGYEWTGISYQERLAGSQALGLFALAFLVVFLVLVALYESWSIPAAVMLIVPIGALGSVLAVTVLGMPNDVYFKVGLITIIGLAAKNAILIVEFAKDLHRDGMGVYEAAVEAARMRFRPIVMTSMAFVLGVVPLAIATGAGAASQRALGVGVIGGMLSATILGVLFVPTFYSWVMGLRARYQTVPDATTERPLTQEAN